MKKIIALVIALILTLGTMGAFAEKAPAPEVFAGGMEAIMAECIPEEAAVELQKAMDEVNASCPSGVGGIFDFLFNGLQNMSDEEFDALGNTINSLDTMIEENPEAFETAAESLLHNLFGGLFA